LKVNPHFHRLHVLYLAGSHNIFTLARDAAADPTASAMWILELGRSAFERLRADARAEFTPALAQELARSSAGAAASTRVKAEREAYATYNTRPHGSFQASRMFHSSVFGTMLIASSALLAAGVVVALALSLPRTTEAQVLMLALAALCAGCAGDWAGRTRRPLAAALALALVPLSAAAFFAVGAAGPNPVTAGLVGALLTAFACGAGVLVGIGRVEAPKIRATERELSSDLTAAEAAEAATRAGHAAAWAIESAEAAHRIERELVQARTLEAFDLYVAERTRAGISFQDAAALRGEVCRLVAEWPERLGLDELRAA
jgi:hypothetical protein